MIGYYIGMYTLTDAQRGRELLQRHQIRARIVRMPAAPGVSCAFGLRLRPSEADLALKTLEQAGIRVGKTVRREDR